MGKAFECRQNDDSFYLPLEVFDKPGLQTSHEFVPVTRRESRYV
jgi:hypothetical protein